MLTLKNMGLAFVFLWFMVGGIAHFTSTDFFVAIMPPYIGFHREIVYISGVFEILGAIGILIPALRQWAGNGLLLLVVCVSPANIHMWLHPELFPDVLRGIPEHSAGGTGGIVGVDLVVYAHAGA